MKNIATRVVVASLLGTTVASAAQEPPEPGCSYLEDGYPVSEVIIENDEGVDTLVSDDPRFSVRLRYPTAALTYPQAARDPVQTAELFTLFAETGLPFSQEDRRSEDGRLLPAQALPPQINILVDDRVEVEHVVAVFEGMGSKRPFSYVLPPLKLFPSPYDDLQEIEIQSVHYAPKERRYVRIEGERIADFVVCAKLGGYVRYPHCQLWFDYKSINVKATFSANYLDEYSNIRSRVEEFISCIYVEGFVNHEKESGAAEKLATR